MNDENDDLCGADAFSEGDTVILRNSVNSARDEALSGIITKSCPISSLHEKCSGLLLVELVDVDAGSERTGMR